MGHMSESALEGFAKQDLALPWKLRVTSWLAILRANLDLDSGAFRHAVRLAVWVAVADAIGPRNNVATILLAAHDGGGGPKAGLYDHVCTRIYKGQKREKEVTPSPKSIT